MKVVILAGGLGTRLAEETEVRPKALVEIGGRPILWHILKHYAHHGFKEFLIALGYKSEQIKRYFLDYSVLDGGMTIELSSGALRAHDKPHDDWTVHLIDTGQETNPGGRVKRLEPWLASEPFMLTYCDGVCDVDLGELLRFHQSCRRLATVTAVRPPSRFGGLVFEGDRVIDFVEKPQIGEGWINGGFMVCEPGVFRFMSGDGDSLEADVLEDLAAEGQLSAYRHESFWQCMDTLRDRRLLESLWKEGHPPWRVWSR